MRLTDAWRNLKSAFTAPAGTPATGWADRVAQEISSGLHNFGAGLVKNTSSAQTSVGKGFGMLADAVMFLPKAVVGAVQGAFYTASTFVVKPVAKGAAVGTVGVGAATGLGAFHIVKQPIAGAMNMSAGAVRWARAHPILSGAAAAVGGVSMAAGWLTNRSARATQNDLVQQAVEAQFGAPAQPQPTYKNSVSADEWAAAQANMKNAEQPAAHAAEVSAVRAQATQQAAAAV